MIYKIGISLTFFLLFILLTKRNKSQADKLLLTWLCVVFVHLLLFVIVSSRQYLHFPFFLGLEIPLPLLHGPLLFFYTTSLTTGRIGSIKILYHLIPYVLALVSLIPFLSLPLEEKIDIYLGGGEAYTTHRNIIFFGIISSGITYSMLSLYSLIRHKRKIKENYSYTEKINLQWLLKLILGLSCIWVVVLVANDEFIFIMVVMYVFMIGYYGIRQVGIFNNHPPLLPSYSTKTTVLENYSNIASENSKDEKSSIPDSQLESIHHKLLTVMSQRKLYLTPELTLAMVSHELSVHPNTLSHIINKMEQKNFFDYINSLRIEEFKERVLQPENHKYTLLAIAYDCGFNSKTSFNRNFKSVVGKSPTEYVRERKIQLP